MWKTPRSGWPRLHLQRLPLPIGSPHPIRRSPHPVRLSAQGRPAFVALLGLAAAATGAVLGAVPPSIAVGLGPDGYRVGDVTLSAQGGGVYASGQGAVIIAADAEAVRASGSTRLRGERMLGSCQMAPDQRSERCIFDLGGRSLTARDQLDHGAWDRRYQDGQAVRIQLDGGRPVPVPIALGR